ncbi:MAG: magnesium transporter [Desulfofustis sp. PB-SRB1]|jgi:magnesium transporter|nr:magnesium transporter [Desulfofustis sp. PB-SRB1]MBM1002233.1 magnesium transporter [Desulfofustis sp. PB-SRB1]
MRNDHTKREMIGHEGMVLLDMIRRLNRKGASGPLGKVIEKTHPADTAWVFRHLNEEERETIFNVVVTTTKIGDFLSELDDAVMIQLVGRMEPRQLADIVVEMPSDDAVDLLETIGEELAAQIRQFMQKQDLEEVDGLLKYHPESAGGLMSTDFMSLDQQLSVGEAIAIIQEKSSEMEMVFYLYITTEDDKLAGVISLRQLLMNRPERKLKDIMNPHVISVNTDTDQGDVAHAVSQYNILAVPVVDSSYRLVGIVTVDDIIDVIREEATEDFLQMAGAGKDREILLKSTLDNAMLRAPWLFASWVGGVLAMFIITAFEYELAKVLALAAFIPVIMGMGGNIATQSSTIIVRGIATGRVNMNELLRVIFKEMRVGILLGFVYGVFLGILCTLIYQEPPLLGLVVGLSIFVIMAMAATIGTFVPLVLKRFGFDAAIATGPFVTTSIDILGVMLYFYTARFILGL